MNALSAAMFLSYRFQNLIELAFRSQVLRAKKDYVIDVCRQGWVIHKSLLYDQPAHAMGNKREGSKRLERWNAELPPQQHG
jgi:hypothetical protein